MTSGTGNGFARLRAVRCSVLLLYQDVSKRTVEIEYPLIELPNTV